MSGRAARVGGGSGGGDFSRSVQAFVSTGREYQRTFGEAVVVISVVRTWLIVRELLVVASIMRTNQSQYGHNPRSTCGCYLIDCNMFDEDWRSVAKY